MNNRPVNGALNSRQRVSLLYCLLLLSLGEFDAYRLSKVQNMSQKQINLADQSKELLSVYETAQSYASEVLTMNDESLPDKVDALLQTDAIKNLYDSISKWQGVEAQLSGNLMNQMYSSRVSHAFTVRLG